MLETAIVAARMAGQRALEELSFIKVSVKNSTELVTQADGQCQQIIIDRIKQTYPDHGFIAEEGTGGGMFRQPPRGGEPIWWVIDPIDGTNNFAKQILLFAVSIAAMYEGEPIVAVVFEPATDSMFTAVRDGEAQLNGRHITAGEDTIDKFSNVAFDSYLGSQVPKWATEIMLRTRFRSLGSAALHLTYVAKGSFIAAVTSTPKLWDIAAGAFIAQSAQAVITDWNGKKIFPVDIDAYQGSELPIIAANRKVHAELLRLVKS